MKLFLFMVLIGIILYWRHDKGSIHSLYFMRLQEQLQKYGVSHPRLVLDLDSLDHNIERVSEHFGDTSEVRIVAKSLPCFELIEYLQEKLQTNRLMVFHQPFLVQQLERFPHADILIGKPFPISALRKTLEHSEQMSVAAVERVKWLVDNIDRLKQYRKLAIEKQVTLKVAVELDVGLHRGGVEKTDELRVMLKQISEDDEHFQFSGFVGYEPHIGKIPELLKGQREPARVSALRQYQEFVDVVKNEFPSLWNDDLCLNGGGSMTYQLYPENDRTPFNELALGSAFVKPTDFDLFSLTDHKPAIYIATPVLKVLDRLQIPVMEKLNGFWKALTPNMARSYFIYGGWWKAVLESPKGLSNNALYGRSTNQELLTGSESTGLGVDDFVFLRPTQSEAVLLQFGRILVVRKEQVVGEWESFDQSY
ncbi:alanine racemase [Sansalvadorimonas sp. 2012CJ34-2]|uniref:Alanine racemase n=1 Tax=Parendozoicomonas callyspongiae TaxID=2942213 RepID=A0ABT0PCQ4_9GAMM|nr:alanine racemase [Sansalvadorimonas sp. 2012CJ34-2]MCL6269165.1 alanine racemase [Sansalvadorimonas sp. 2012CJ34-2]